MKARHKDGGSLFLEVKAPGQASWVYRWGSNNNPYHIGTWVDHTLPEARTAHAQARDWVRQGLNPSQQRKLIKADLSSQTATTFKGLAEEWLEMKREGWSVVHYTKSRQAIERDVYPALASLPVAQITTAMAHTALEPLHKRAPITWSRVRQHVAQIFDMARIKGLRDDNPVVKVDGATRSTGKLHARQPALLKLVELGQVLRDTEAANTSPTVKLALWMLSRMATRPGELIRAKCVRVRA